MRTKLSVIALIAAFLVIAAWATHHVNFIGLLRRLHGGLADRPGLYLYYSPTAGSLGLVQLDGRSGEPGESPGLLVLLFHSLT